MLRSHRHGFVGTKHIMKTSNQDVCVLFLSFSTHSSAALKRNIQASEVSGRGTDAVAPRGRNICRMLRRGVCMIKGLETQDMMKLELKTHVSHDECIL